MPFLTHQSGQRTFYYDDSFADPWTPTETILIHHGFGRSSNFWFQWVPILAKRYRVIRRDALGHGYSSVPPNGHPKTVDSLLDEIIDTLNQLKIEKVHYIGESTGGIFGEFLAARYPERLHSLAIISSPLAFGPPAQALLSFGFPTVMDTIRELGLEAWGEKCLEVLRTGGGGPEEFKAWWLEQFTIPQADGVIAYAEVICREDFDANSVIDRIKVPFLSLAPADSGLVDLDDQKRLTQTIEGAQLQIISSSGHEIYLDQAKLCQKRYLEFLDTVGN